MKKVISFVLVAVMAVSLLSVCAFAASDVNDYEQKILNSLGEKVVVNGKEVAIDASLINQAKNYVMRDDVNITETQATEILGYVAQAKETAKTSGTVSAGKFSQEVNSKIVALADKAAAVVGLSVAVSSNNSIIVKDATTGEVVCQSAKPIKNTGASQSALQAVVIASLLAMAAAGAVCVKKFSL